MVEQTLIEFPSAAYHGNSNGAIMIGVCRVAAEIALYTAFRYGKPRFFSANDLRRRGQGNVIANDARPKLFRRIYGGDPPSEHVCDAALIVAAHLRVI